MPDPYDHKLALVTGGSSGIGLALAVELAGRGAHVWILSRDPLKLEKALAFVNQARQSPEQKTGVLQVDLTHEAAARRVLEGFFAETGVPDLLINCAGAAHPCLVEETCEDVYREMMEVNYFGTVHACMAVLPGMLERGSGRIINFASAAALAGVPGYAAYGASKYAVRCLSDVMRVELKHRGIRVSCVFPTDVDTPQLAYENQFKPQLTRAVEEVMGVVKIGDPHVVARQVLDAAARGKYIILPGVDAKFSFYLLNFLGIGIYPLGDILMRIVLRQRKPAHAQPPEPQR